MTRDELILQIESAFRGVTLENGIGLWEAHGHDNYMGTKECESLRAKDEKENWKNIPVLDLYRCSSGLSFFDAKGMRFHLPQFLLFDLDVFDDETERLHAQEDLQSSLYFPPDVVFTLSYNLEEEYARIRFSLLNKEQMQCIIDFFEYKKQEVKETYDRYFEEYGTDRAALYTNESYIQLDNAKQQWQSKLRALD
jgi:hypothetical protein